MKDYSLEIEDRRGITCREILTSASIRVGRGGFGSWPESLTGFLLTDICRLPINTVSSVEFFCRKKFLAEPQNKFTGFFL